VNKKKSFSILLTVVLVIMSLIPSSVFAENVSVLKVGELQKEENTNKPTTKGGAKDVIPQLAPAQPGNLEECVDLLETFDFNNTTITSAELVAEGTLSNAGKPVGEHCLVKGKMNERVSPVDGQTYAIGFEMRLPVEWAGRFLYQANGGADGNVVTANGSFGGGPLENGLQKGFAVISSDAGHTSTQNVGFGFDPQARLDFGYQAVGTLTPMAKSLIKAAYGREPDRSYIAGGSNGGRHTMVAASRYADQYDGFLAIAPGFNLPQSAVAQLWGVQQWAKVATDINNLETALPLAERQVIAQAILDRCDGLDRLNDGIVQDTERCQEVFSVERDVPTCDLDRDGTCLTVEQKQVVKDVFAGARTSSGEQIYTSFPFDPGLVHNGWGLWKFKISVALDPGTVSHIFLSPPEGFNGKTPPEYALSFDVDNKWQLIYESNDLYTQSAMEFMTPPDPTNLDTLRNSGAKMIVAHGSSDGIFSSDDTRRWYKELDANYRNKADEFVRYFEVPGMGHVSGGPATDQFDGLGALIDWVEYGKAPERIIATARGEGNPGGVNPEVPSTWAPDRSRPLCAYPLVARYKKGDPEVASSFECKPSSGGPGLSR
jgi:Tannase and feruloyl esterase